MVLQLSGQRGHAPMDVGLHRSWSDAHGRGGFGFAQLGVVAQHDRLALPVGQQPQGLSKRQPGVTRHGCRFGRRDMASRESCRALTQLSATQLLVAQAAEVLANYRSAGVEGFLRQSDTMSETTLVRSFSKWVRDTILPHVEAAKSKKNGNGKKSRK